MRVLVTCQPAFGHLHPLVPLAGALQSAGHDVRFATAASFRAPVEAAGFPLIPAGLDWLESDIVGAFPEYVAHRAAGRGKWFVQSEIFAWHTATAMADGLADALVDWRPDLIVREEWEIGGAITAANLAVRCAVFGIGPVTGFYDLLDVAHDRLVQLQVEPAGLGWLNGDVYVDSCPESLRRHDDPPAPTRAVSIQPFTFSARSPGSSPSLRRRDRRLVYVGLGTVVNRFGDVLERLIGELAELSIDVIVTVGPGRDPNELHPPHAGVRIEQYVPLDELLPACDAVVCHAGWGTTMAALAHGLPMVLVPIAADQPAIASRCDEAGVSRTVAPADVGSGAVAAALTAVLNDDTHRANAARISSEIQHMATPLDVARDIETIIA